MRLAAPATSRNVPRFELVVTVTKAAVPVNLRLPAANGVPAVGRTRTFCHVNEHVTPLALVLVTVKVSCVGVTEVIATVVPLATPLILLPALPLPPSRSTTTLGAVPPVSKINPLGAFKMIVPLPASPVTFSEKAGPVKLVNEPPVASAEIAPPPVATVY